MHQTKIIFFDIDGTLIDMQKKHISKKHWKYCVGFGKRVS